MERHTSVAQRPWLTKKQKEGLISAQLKFREIYYSRSKTSSVFYYPFFISSFFRYIAPSILFIFLFLTPSLSFPHQIHMFSFSPLYSPLQQKEEQACWPRRLSIRWRSPCLQKEHAVGRHRIVAACIVCVCLYKKRNNLVENTTCVEPYRTQNKRNVEVSIWRCSSDEGRKEGKKRKVGARGGGVKSSEKVIGIETEKSKNETFYIHPLGFNLFRLVHLPILESSCQQRALFQSNHKAKNLRMNKLKKMALDKEVRGRSKGVVSEWASERGSEREGVRSKGKEGGTERYSDMSRWAVIWSNFSQKAQDHSPIGKRRQRHSSG